MALSPQWLDELRTRTSLSGLVRRTVKLVRAGNEWKACCPFHNEKSPSFYVNEAKGFYHCFGCGAHGDAIRWLTDNQGLPFMDAVKELAAEAGLDVPAPDPAFAARAEQRATLHDVAQAAQDWFVANLASAAGGKGREYLSSRGLDAHLVGRFGFGWAPDERGALRQALGRFEDALLIEAGLLITVDDREPYDRFRGRITLPIQDVRGRVIGFGGRILEAAANAPKYLNSPDTPLFDKGRTLYNLHRAGPASRKSGRLVVVEGYMDVVALASAGIEEAVAPMGTALTEQQLELLWRLADKPVLCFDGDAAGRRAAMKAITRALPLVQPGKSLEIVCLPAGLDPDDLVREQGAAALERLLANPISMLELIWQHEHAAHPLAAPEDKAGLKARLLAHVDTIAHPDIRALYRRDLLDRFSAFAFPPRAPEAPRGGTAAPSVRRGAPRPLPRLSPEGAAQLRQSASGGARDQLGQAVLEGLARHPDQIGRHAEALLQLAAAEPRLSEAVDQLLERGQTLEAELSPPISGAGTQAPPPGSTCYSFLMEGHDPDDAREDLAEAVTLLVERPALDAAIAAATARFAEDPETAFAEQQRLRKRKLEIESRLGHLARKRAAPAVLEDDLAAHTYSWAGEQDNGTNHADGDRS
jgi:DNA primase